MALTGAGLSGRDGHRTARARFIPVLDGGGACPVSGLDHGFTGSCEQLVERGMAGWAPWVSVYWTPCWCTQNATSKDTRCRLKDRKGPILVFGLTGCEP